MYIASRRIAKIFDMRVLKNCTILNGVSIGNIEVLHARWMENGTRERKMSWPETYYYTFCWHHQEVTDHPLPIYEVPGVVCIRTVRRRGPCSKLLVGLGYKHPFCIGSFQSHPSELSQAS